MNSYHLYCVYTGLANGVFEVEGNSISSHGHRIMRGIYGASSSFVLCSLAAPFFPLAVPVVNTVLLSVNLASLYCNLNKRKTICNGMERTSIEKPPTPDMLLMDIEKSAKTRYLPINNTKCDILVANYEQKVKAEVAEDIKINNDNQNKEEKQLTKDEIANETINKTIDDNTVQDQKKFVDLTKSKPNTTELILDYEGLQLIE